MQVGVVACETHFRTYAYKDGLGSALKCAYACVHNETVSSCYGGKRHRFLIAPRAILGFCYA